MLFRYLGVVAALGLLPMTAQAAVLYNFTLVSANVAANGTGSVLLNSAPAATGTTTYAPGTFSGLNFTVGGQAFSGGSTNGIRFVDGMLASVTYGQSMGSTPNRFALQVIGLGYTFSFNDLRSDASGTVGAAPAASGVPEPASWIMIIAGVALMGAGLRSRRVTAARVSFG